MEKIEIDFDVHKEIEKRRNSFEDTPNDVLRKIFNLQTAIGSKVTSSSAMGVSQGISPGLTTKGVFFKNGTKLRNTSRNTVFSAEIQTGKIIYNGKTYKSLSKAGGVATGVSTNGWIFWEFYNEKEERWELCDKLRRSNNSV